MVPPFRATYSARFEGGAERPIAQRPYVVGRRRVERAGRRKLDPEDFAPEGYTLANLGAGVSLPVGARSLGVDLQLRNAFNKEYESFLSRYKTYAFDPGRNFTVRVRTDF